MEPSVGRPEILLQKIEHNMSCREATRSQMIVASLNGGGQAPAWGHEI